MRVIAGRYGGRRLLDAPASGVRPTSDRVREALFARLGDLAGQRVLDLCAGTGALGIEALSRGAASVVFVERSRAALDVLRRNLAALEAESAASVLAGDARARVRRLGRAGEAFDLVLVDPPYAAGELAPILEAVVEARVLFPTGEVVAETSRRHPLPAVAGLVLLDTRRYGDTVLGWYRLEAVPDQGDGGSHDDPAQ